MPGRKDMPSSVTNEVSGFDRFAVTASEFVSKPWFFTLCVLLILVWAPSFFLFKTVDTWQLIINTATTIVTFLLVALLQNTQQRADQATQHKLNAIADGLANLMRSLSKDHPQSEALKNDLKELRKAVGLEHRESS
ncbi:MAG TPA: low affinity iron permease family protein [Candidatus Limnocylindrales bacterium]|nr:low affinity iron permease family protein [Candidatus Limnocylindrales bacterium]